MPALIELPSFLVIDLFVVFCRCLEMTKKKE